MLGLDRMTRKLLEIHFLFIRRSNSWGRLCARAIRWKAGPALAQGTRNRKLGTGTSAVTALPDLYLERTFWLT